MDMIGSEKKAKYNFEFSFFSYAEVNLKCGQSHWKWYEQVKLCGYYHHVNFDIWHIYLVQENRNVKGFAMPNCRPAQRPSTDLRLDTYILSKSRRLSYKLQGQVDSNTGCDFLGLQQQGLE